MVWKPNVTVAAIVERDGSFLMVEEETAQGLRFNQPAGHLEPGESLVDAVVRETLEETRYHFRPQALVGIYSWRNPDSATTYLRFAFAGEIVGFDPQRDLDVGIVAAHWIDADRILAETARHRSPMVATCLGDFLAGRRTALDVLVSVV